MKIWRLSLALIGLLAMLAGGSRAAFAEEGNSDAAHACQKGGYLTLVGSGGETFATAGDCVSFAAAGGTFASGIVIPAGQRVTFSNLYVSACNGLEYGYTINGSGVSLGSKPAGCSTLYPIATTIGPFSTAIVLRVYLTDTTCDATYFSDGNHAKLTLPATGYQIDIADAGSGCNRESTPAQNFTTGNFSVLVTVHP